MGPLEGTRALVGAAAHTPKPTCGESKRDQRRNFVRWSACIHSFAVMREQASRRAMAGPLRWSRRCALRARKADAAQGTIRDRSECNALGAADHSTGDRPSLVRPRLEAGRAGPSSPGLRTSDYSFARPGRDTWTSQGSSGLAPFDTSRSTFLVAPPGRRGILDPRTRTLREALTRNLHPLWKRLS